MRFDGRKLINRLLLAFVMFTLTAASFEGFFVKWSFHDDYFDSILDGTLLRPWAYRRLMPEAANAFRSSLSLDQRDELTAMLEQDNFLSAKFRQTDIQPRYIIEYYFMYAASFVSFLLSAFVMRRLCTEATGDPIAGTLGSMLFILIFPLLSTVGGYFYDFTELLFFSTAALMAWRGNWIGLLLLTPFAELNKEAYFFLLFALYPLLRRTMPLRKTLLTLGSTLLIAGLIYVAIHEHYAANPGSTTIFFLPTNIEVFAPLIALLIIGLIFERHRAIAVALASTLIAALIAFDVPIVERYFIVEHTYSILSGEQLFLPHLLMLGWLIKSTWSQLPLEWRRHATIAAAINFPLWLLFCYPGELRNLSLLYPTLVVMLSVYINGVIRR
ncbi:MAG: hypothetical protein IJ668_11590 [Selenomonadaceae bacterium]|nr:hypothetical protein [Selenomonadaceae bacterium]